MVNLKMVKDMTECVKCNQFYGTEDHDNLCSHCWLRSQGQPIPVPVAISALNDCAIVFAQPQPCLICAEEKLEFQIYACCCVASLCLDCAKTIRKCPTCRASAYVHLTKSEVELLVSLFDESLPINRSNLTLIFMKLLSNHHEQLEGRVTWNSFKLTGQLMIEVVKNKCHPNSYHDVLYALSDFILFEPELNAMLRQADLPTYDDCLSFAVNQYYPQYPKRNKWRQERYWAKRLGPWLNWQMEI